MKHLKSFELLNGANITNSLKMDIEKASNNWNDIMTSIVYNEYGFFKKNINNINLEQVDINGNTPLLLASIYGRLKMLKKLIKNGANIFHKNNSGDDFYDIANRYKFINSMKDWIEKKYPEFVVLKKYNL